MSTYILLVNSTDQGAKAVREIPNRQQASRDTAAKLGIVRKNVYMTFGPYDSAREDCPNKNGRALRPGHLHSTQ
jgi:uncharacterized protein with GYD domain